MRHQDGFFRIVFFLRNRAGIAEFREFFDLVEHIVTRGLCCAARAVRGRGIGVILVLARILNDQAVAVVREVLGRDHDDIPQRADAEAAAREQPEDARADLADVEAMDAEITQEDGEEQRH